MNERTLSIVREFADLPPSEEKDHIEQLYLQDEIGSLEFFSKVREYVEKVKEEESK